MRGAGGRLNHGARWGTPNRRFPLPGQRPLQRTPGPRLVVSPIPNVARPLSYIESKRFGVDLGQIVTRFKFVKRDAKRLSALVGIVKELLPPAIAVWKAQHGHALPHTDPLLDEHATFLQYLELRSFIVQAFEADTDDAFGVAHLNVAVYRLLELLDDNLHTLVLMAAFANHPEIGMPHPADLRAVIVESSVATAALGTSRTPTGFSTIGPPLSDRERIAAATWHRQGPRFEVLVKGDVRALLVHLGWDGRDRRCEVV